MDFYLTTTHPCFRWETIIALKVQVMLTFAKKKRRQNIWTVYFFEILYGFSKYTHCLCYLDSSSLAISTWWCSSATWEMFKERWSFFCTCLLRFYCCKWKIFWRMCKTVWKSNAAESRKGNWFDEKVFLPAVGGPLNLGLFSGFNNVVRFSI